MNSFYGGRQGHSFIISKVYTSIKEMVEEFGYADCPVNYNEYVLINTENRNHPENGNIYRRGYDYNGIISTYHPSAYRKPATFEIENITSNGAVYVGNIVGPAGPAPTLEVDSYEAVSLINKIYEKKFEDFGFEVTDIGEPKYVDVIDKLKEKQNDLFEEINEKNEKPIDSEIDFCLLKLSGDDNNIIHYYCYNNNIGGWYATESFNNKIGIFNADNLSLVPAVKYMYKEGTDTLVYEEDEERQDGILYIAKEAGSYVNDIKWTYCVVRDVNGQDSIVKIGFQFVVPMFEMVGKAIDPIEYQESLEPLVIRLDKKADIESKPFYSTWQIKIPKGVNGSKINNLRIIDFNSAWTENDAPRDNEISFDSENKIIKTFPYINFKTDKIRVQNNENVRLVVYDYVDYSYKKEGEVICIYLCEYISGKKLEKIEIDSEGYIVLTYEGEEPYRFSTAPIQLIESLEYNKDTGELYVIYNTTDEQGNKDKVLVGTIDIITPASAQLSASNYTDSNIKNTKVITGGSVYKVEVI